MNTKDSRIWAYSVRFLKVFSPLLYDRVPINHLLFRDFQRFCKKNIRHLPDLSVKRMAAHQLHLACEPFFVSPERKLKIDKEGFTLVRAELFSAVREVKHEKFIYLAHTKREYDRMRKIKACRPLFLLQNLKPVVNVRQRKKVFKQLATIYRSKKTPALFKSQRFRRWMKKKLTKTLLRLSRVHRLFKMKPMKQIIYGSTLNHHGSTVTGFSQSRGIPVINVQHGVFGTFGHIPANADWNIVWSKAHADFLIDHGVPEHKIKISTPYFARSMHPYQKTKLQRNAKFKLLVATQPVKSTRKLFQTIEIATQHMENKTLVYYKLHPDQRNVSLYRSWIKNKSSHIIPHGTANLQHLLQQADLVVTPFSTVGYEALMHNKPVFFFGHKKCLYYLKNRPICFRTASDLKRLIHWMSMPKIKPKLIVHMKLKDEAPDDFEASNNGIWETIQLFREEALAARDDETTEIDSDHPREGRIERIAGQEHSAI